MNPKWERVAAPPRLDGEMILDAVYRPTRSLSPQAFRLMLIIVIAFNCAVSAVFIAQGAFPVAGFLGLDVLALWLAFHMNYRAARAEERVRIAPGQVHVEQRNAKGASRHWVLNPIWARVESDEGGVLIAASGKRLRLGAQLSPKERRALARGLDDALWRAKKAPLQST